MSSDDKNEMLELVEDEDGVVAEPEKRWRIAIIDDDQAVHDGTRYALSDYELNGYGLELLYAHSAEEGKALMAKHQDIAVVLLDVVMERETAGLELVEYIRKVLKNETVRIVLRTGQPGQAPERRVILDYDINDYKAKTDLTADRLFTTMTAALRSYHQLARINQTRRGLEIILDAASGLFDFKSMQRLAEGVLTQLSSLLEADCQGMLVLREQEGRDFSILACSGCYRALVEGVTNAALGSDLVQQIQRAFLVRQSQFSDRSSTLYFKTVTGAEVIVILDVQRHLSETDRALVEIFCARLAVAFDNVVLYEQLQRSNDELDLRVTERTRELQTANARLRTQWLRARRANELQREILGTVAHDIRNPLAVVLGRTEIMKEMIPRSEGLNEKLMAQVEFIRTAASRLSDMVSSLLADALSDAMDITLRREKFDFVAMARDVIDANLVLSQGKGQAITFTSEPSMVCIDADPDRLREAIDNLISNAIKYSPLDESIDIAIEADADDLLFAVSDHGPGLVADDMARLFGRFQRLSAKPTAGEASTGLGLSIAKKIVDLHGGQLTATSEGAGTGSTFYMRLPLDRSAPR
jgi:signal transduction histidine kinase/DNA-binding NarL/FixJ family response regulator